MFDRTVTAWAIYHAATPENLRELAEYGNASPIADAVVTALTDAMHKGGVSNRPLSAATLATAEAASGAGEREESWTGDPHGLAAELRRVASKWKPGFRLPQLLRDAADEIDCLSTRTTAEAASGAGERKERAAFLAGFDAATKMLDDSVALGDHRWPEHRASAADKFAASLPPATDPAISGLSSFPPNWKLRQMHFSAPCADDRKWHVNVYGGREGGDTFVGRGASADQALRDAARNARAALAAAPTIPATGEAIKTMVDRFLAWPLPADFHPDNGISATRPNYGEGVEWRPIGTNLLTAAQAEAMIWHILGEVKS